MEKRLDPDEYSIRRRSRVSAGKELLSSPLKAADSLMGLDEIYSGPNTLPRTDGVSF